MDQTEHSLFSSTWFSSIYLDIIVLIFCLGGSSHTHTQGLFLSSHSLFYYRSFLTFPPNYWFSCSQCWFSLCRYWYILVSAKALLFFSMYFLDLLDIPFKSVCCERDVLFSVLGHVTLSAFSSVWLLQSLFITSI